MEKEKTQEKADTQSVYEVSFLLLPSLALEQVPNETDSIKGVIKELGGSVISFEEPILIDLAYPMVKVVQTDRIKATQGYFGWIKFEMSKDDIEAVKKALDGNLNVIRYLIIKTVKENTLLLGKMKLQKEVLSQADDSSLDDADLEDDSSVDDVSSEEEVVVGESED